jgi:hypothetical protein
VRPRRARLLIWVAWWLLCGLIAIAFILAPTARADGTIDYREWRYITQAGAGGLICVALTINPSVETAYGLVGAVMEDGFAPDSAADIVNRSVTDFCPQHWGLISKAGRQARGNLV